MTGLRWAVGLVALAVLSGASGCGLSQASKLTLGVESARVGDESVYVTVSIDNPSDYDLHVHELRYDLALGSSPISSGVWAIERELRKGERLTVGSELPIQSAPADPAATRVELSGTIVVYPEGGTSAQAFTDTAFSARGPVEPVPAE